MSRKHPASRRAKSAQQRQVQKIRYQNRTAIITQDDIGRVRIYAEGQPEVGASIRSNAAMVLEQIIFKAPHYCAHIEGENLKTLGDDIKECKPVYTAEDGTRVYR